MDTKLIPLSKLEADTQGMLSECCDTGQALIVELPDHRFVTIHSLEPADDDSATSELLETNAAFRALVEKSKAGPRRPFPLKNENPRSGQPFDPDQQVFRGLHCEGQQ